MIAGKIDVTKIDKKRLFVGKHGTYLDFVLIDTPDNKYGNDYMIVESITKEERESGMQSRILGSAKIIAKKQQVKQESTESPDASLSEMSESEIDDLPF